MHTKALAHICGLTGNGLRGLDTQCAQSIVKTAAHEKTQLMRMLMCTIIFWSMAICSSTMQHAIVEEDSHSIYNLQSSLFSNDLGSSATQSCGQDGKQQWPVRRLGVLCVLLFSTNDRKVATYNNVSIRQRPLLFRGVSESLNVFE